MENKPEGEAAPEATPEPVVHAEPVVTNLFAQRAWRQWLVNGLVVAMLAAVAISAWPTESRKVEKRAKEYLSVAFRGDGDAAYAFLSPESRKRLPLKFWWPANRSRLAASEVVSAEVDSGGQTASVVMADTRSRVKRTTTWVKVGAVWYHDYDGRQ